MYANAYIEYLYSQHEYLEEMTNIIQKLHNRICILEKKQPYTLTEKPHKFKLNKEHYEQMNEKNNNCFVIANNWEDELKTFIDNHVENLNFRVDDLESVNGGTEASEMKNNEESDNFPVLEENIGWEHSPCDPIAERHFNAIYKQNNNLDSWQ